MERCGLSLEERTRKILSEADLLLHIYEDMQNLKEKILDLLLTVTKTGTPEFFSLDWGKKNALLLDKTHHLSNLELRPMGVDESFYCRIQAELGCRGGEQVMEISHVFHVGKAQSEWVGSQDVSFSSRKTFTFPVETDLQKKVYTHLKWFIDRMYTKEE